MNLCKTCGTICPFDDERTECDAYAPMTNENWFISLPTEEKAKFFARLKKKYFWQGFNWADDEEVFGQPDIESDTKRFENWLKEKHDE